MYQRYPGEGAPSSEPSAPASVPQSVLRAVQFMYAGAAVSLIGIIVDMTTLSSTRSAILKAHPTYTTAQLNTAQHFAIGEFIAGGLIGAALWLWMAQSCRAGKGWARVVSTVFFGIDTLSVLVGATALAGGGATWLYGVLVWLIGLAAVVLLWRRSSSDYFRGGPR